MRSTLQNCGQTISQAIFFSIIIISLNATLPAALSAAALNVGAPQQIADVFSATPASGALFAAFLGYNPISTMLHALSPALTDTLSQSALATLTGQDFFPNAIASPFMMALREAFLFAAVLCFLAAACSAMHGGKYVYKEPVDSSTVKVEEEEKPTVASA
jgi:hypothetical protein